MKTLFLMLVAILGLGAPTNSAAVEPAAFNPEVFKSESVALRNGTQRTVARGELRIRFVNVMEDSRCPVDVNCIWEGNAKIRVRVTDRRGRTKVMELNTSGEHTGDQFGRYAISLVNLTPKPTQNRKPSPSRYNARLSIQPVRR